MTNPLSETAKTYRRWALVESNGTSATYERLALAVADDRTTLTLLQQVEPARRQPNLLFGALRWYDADVTDPVAALAWAAAHPAQVLDVLRTWSTQTNEAARCALLLPGLALLAERCPGPLAVVEIGASAGLCLLYDAWRYRYDTADGVHELGPLDSPVTLPCTVTGRAPLPDAVPMITWRAGVDLHPIDPTDADARRWLQCLVWPEHTERAARLDAALDVAASAPPDMRAGDMRTDLAELLEQARRGPAGSEPATVVVTHTAALVYLTPPERAAVRARIAEAGAHRLGGEHGGVLPDVDGRLSDPASVHGRLVVSLDDEPLALAHPHGAAMAWL